MLYEEVCRAVAADDKSALRQVRQPPENPMETLAASQHIFAALSMRLVLGSQSMAVLPA